MTFGATRARHARPGRPWTPPAARAALAGIAVLLVLVAWWWWTGRPRPVTPVDEPMAVTATGVPWPEAAPQPSGALTVHVSGRVRRPGIVTVPPGSRVIDAIDAAGGLTKPSRDPGVNLARQLTDGEQIIVGTSGGSSVSTGDPAAPSVLDLNRATATELETLPGIGPVLAERIVTWRETNGPFPSVDVLGEVPGIGDVLLGQLRPLVRV